MDRKILTPTNYEVIQFDSKTNVVFYTSVDTGSYISPHWHDALEIIYMQEGELRVSFENREHYLKADQCILIRPNLIHSTLCTSLNRAIVFQIPVMFLEKYIPDINMRWFDLNSSSKEENIECFKETLRKMQFLIDHRPDGYVIRFNSLLFDILYQLYANFSTGNAEQELTQNRNLEKLKPVLEYISDHYAQPISLDEIASVAMLQSKYFCRFFKKNMGISFLQYQNEIRLSKIYLDLITTDDKITNILDRHGFSNYKLFRKMFREQFHSTPTIVRKEQKKSR